MNVTGIEWTSKTWNPITGCPGPKVSPGCAHCYAERTAKTRLAGRYGYDADDPFGIHIHDERWLQPLKAKKPQRIFVCSMGDLFHKSVSLQYVAKAFAVMAMCPQHTFLLLTKREDRMEQFVSDTSTLANDRRGIAYQEIALAAGRDCNMDGLPWPLPNVWLGVTVCNQEEAAAKLPVLLQTQAAKRFVSIEPMLGPVDLSRYLEQSKTVYRGDGMSGYLDYEYLLDWIICGGETGPNSRPMHPAWVRHLRDQCQDAGVPFFFKGWGEWRQGKLAISQSTGCSTAWPDGSIGDGIAETKGGTGLNLHRVGKKESGRLLDGREWNEVPS